jgi:hypothetical protein
MFIPAKISKSKLQNLKRVLLLAERRGISKRPLSMA